MHAVQQRTLQTALEAARESVFLRRRCYAMSCQAPLLHTPLSYLLQTT
jgi:hypothetical protein